ncbi:Cysteine-rich receptor-like protein kinase 43, partial [Linum grandiflorum]
KSLAIFRRQSHRLCFSNQISINGFSYRHLYQVRSFHLHRQTPNSPNVPPTSQSSKLHAARRRFPNSPPIDALKSMGIVCTSCRCIGTKADGDDAAETSDLFFPLRTLQIATNFFSDLNQLGHGGFGPVFKGLMPNGQEIAVKKLSLNSRQGVREFTNEVKLLLRIQHKNLVTLLGCCVEGPEKMLVYEYLPNKSLDYFLFDKQKSSSLEWTTRFRIVTGVARGILYLHEEAPMRILHRDIKASNILLDEALNAKISDFGLARLFPEDDTHVNTFKISGTHGYMAPEYAMHGYLSVKTDVFSYGILVLEIVSGRNNLDPRLGQDHADILNSAWILYQAEKAMELLDSSLASYNRDEVEMCIQLGLLCCQQTVADRPDMNSVNLMLSSDSFSLPPPGKPGMQGRAVGRWTSTGEGGTSSALTTTNPTTTTKSGFTKGSCGGGISSVEDYSRNSMSVSSMDEGR